MVDFTCPWCDEDGVLPFIALEGPEVSFSCSRCGTTVDLVDDREALELAA